MATGGVLGPVAGNQVDEPVKTPGREVTDGFQVTVVTSEDWFKVVYAIDYHISFCLLNLRVVVTLL
jgi:hypothetical protein